MPGSSLSPTLALVLLDLRRTSPKVLLRTAVQDLVTSSVFGLVPVAEPEGPGDRLKRRRGRAPRLWLTDGGAPPPTSRALWLVKAAVDAVPSDFLHGRPARDLTGVARHLARQHRLPEEVRDAALAELESRGLVTRTEGRVLGVFRREKLQRTPAGEAALVSARTPVRRDAGTEYGLVHAGGESARDPNAGEGARGADGAADVPADFEPAFDAGYGSDGGGDGGGGE